MYKLPIDYRSLTQPQRREVREQYIKLQNGKCSHCGAVLTGSARSDMMAKYINRRLFPDSFFKYPVHLHHDHGTGLTIGAVHNQCNAVLWQYHGE